MKQEAVLAFSLGLLLLTFPEIAFPEGTSAPDKKDVLVTEGAAHPAHLVHGRPPRSPRPHPDHFELKALVERARNALQALRRLEAGCAMGISRWDYTRTLAESEAAVNLFANGGGADFFPDIKVSLVKALVHYREVNDYMELSELEGGIRRQQGRKLEARQVEEKYQELIGQALAEASDELAIASPLLSYRKRPEPQGTQTGAAAARQR